MLLVKMMKLLLTLLLWTSAVAFAPTTSVRHRPVVGDPLRMATAQQQHEEVMVVSRRRVFGTMATAGGLLSLAVPFEASAATVKELDMSLPSYGDLKDSKASAENVPSLSVDAKKGGGMGVQTSQKKRGGSDGGKKEKSKEKKEKTDAQGYIF